MAFTVTARHAGATYTVKWDRASCLEIRKASTWSSDGPRNWKAD